MMPITADVFPVPGGPCDTLWHQRSQIGRTADWMKGPTGCAVRNRAEASEALGFPLRQRSASWQGPVTQ